MQLNNDSVELIEEYMDAERTNLVCRHINSISDRIWCVSLRKCLMNDADFEKILRAIRPCKEIRYLNFNLDAINTPGRIGLFNGLVPHLANLDTICLHSSAIGDDGFRLLHETLLRLPHLRSLDVGECQLTDLSVPYIRETIHRRAQTHGLEELTLSSNYGITPSGWARILIAVAAAADMKRFHADYNNLDDKCGYLIVAILSANHTIKFLDLERTGLTNRTALLMIYLMKNYHLSIECINIMNNPIDEALIAEIERYIRNDFSIEVNKKSKKLPSSDAKTSLKKSQKTGGAAKSFGNLFSGGREKRYYYSNDESGSNDEGYEPSTGRSTVGTNTPRGNLNYELRKRDQEKLEEYVKYANKLNKSRQHDRDHAISQYERTIERDYNTNINKIYSIYDDLALKYGYAKKQPSRGGVVGSDGVEAEPDDIETETLLPVADYKYKTHSVLPFNLKHHHLSLNS